MPNRSIRYRRSITDDEWGLTCSEVCEESRELEVNACLVRINDIESITKELSRSITDTSWMYALDEATRRQFERTANDTIRSLLTAVRRSTSPNGISGQFGELVISYGSARSLQLIFEHALLPISEIWKPRVRQNEGFDFHSVCKLEKINFGESKYVSGRSPYRAAATQAKDFLNEEKHFRDRPYLRDLVSSYAIDNLDSEAFGIIVAFSISGRNPDAIMGNALDTVIDIFAGTSVDTLYVIGVEH